MKFLKKPCAYLLSHISVLDKLMTDFVYMLECKNVSSDKVSALSATVVLSFGAGLIVGLLFASVIAGFAVVLLLAVIFVTTLKSFIDKRNDELRDSVPDALRSMGSCFQSGYTLLQTFEFLAKESEGEIKFLFEKCSNILKTGGTIPEALEQLKGNESAPELAFVAVALDVQHQSGGSMGPVIDAARDMVESRLDLLQKLKVQTAQAKLSARVVTILPFALIACFSIISPNFLAPFFSSVLGIVVLCVAAIMQIAGVICVRKMLDVKV